MYLNKIDEALIHIEKALKKIPNDAYFVYIKGTLYSKQGKILESLKLIENAIKLDPAYKKKAKDDMTDDLKNISTSEKFKNLIKEDSDAE